MRQTRRGITLVELLVVVAALAVLATLFILTLTKGRQQARVQRCQHNLTLLCKQMYTYLGEYGDNRFLQFPLGRGQRPDDFNGAEWLASLYWVEEVPDPDVFLCPASGDTNHGGRDLGKRRAPPGLFGSQTVSYAGLHYYSFGKTDQSGNPKGEPIRDDLPPNEPVACDDTQGGINHRGRFYGGMNVIFFDGHVEFKPDTVVDTTSEHGSVGKEPGLLWRLRN